MYYKITFEDFVKFLFAGLLIRSTIRLGRMQHQNRLLGSLTYTALKVLSPIGEGCYSLVCFACSVSNFDLLTFNFQ